MEKHDILIHIEFYSQGANWSIDKKNPKTSPLIGSVYGSAINTCQAIIGTDVDKEAMLWWV